MKDAFIQVGHMRLWDDEVLMLTLKEGVEIELEGIEELLETSRSMSDDKLPLVIVAWEHTLTRDAHIALAKADVFSCVAMALEKSASRNIYEFVEDTFKPVYEMQIFDTMSEALQWARTIK